MSNAVSDHYKDHRKPRPRRAALGKVHRPACNRKPLRAAVLNSGSGAIAASVVARGCSRGQVGRGSRGCAANNRYLQTTALME
jgi:hypothetical protein